MTAGTAPAGIDPDGVAAWLTASAGLQAPLAYTRVGHGQSNLTYLVEDAGGRRLVLRRPPLGELARGAHDMAREHKLLSALADTPVPTPRPAAFTDDPAVTGAPVYVMEHVDGLVLHTDEAAGRLSPDARRRAGLETATTLARLHDVDVDAVGLGDLGRRERYAERQLAGWSRQLEATRTRELPVLEDTAQRLRTRIPEQRHTSVVHGDYNLANLIVGPQGDLRAVLDWELSTLGDPIADLGTLLCYWPDTPDQAVQERDPVPLLDGFPSRAELLDAYASAGPDRDLGAVGFWLALATWKLAVILEGVLGRRKANAANSHSSVDRLTEATDHLADAAAELAAGLR